MVIFVNEIQNRTSTTYVFDTLAEAQAKYYYILSFAAASDIERHGAIMYTGEGQMLENKVFIHNANT